MTLNKVVISGGGTGGHIFPAVAIADEIKRRNPDAEILFVGAEGKMEMEKVPLAGYKIIGLPIAGLQRKLTWKNLTLPIKILKSMSKARRILQEFRPEVVVGVGGYASGPTLKAATMLHIPALIQEQNSFAGKTNKLLGKSVQRICVAYAGLERFFPSDKIVFTGNPVRSDVVRIEGKRREALDHYGFDASKQTLLVIGGSLGARTLNESVLQHLDTLVEQGVQVLWQCGKLYYEELHEKLKHRDAKGVQLVQFIARMDLAYAVADVVVSRAGAISVSELCLVAKPVILVPSPNVAEDHQTHNAMALVSQVAALIVKDNEAREHLVPTALKLLRDEDLRKELALNIKLLGRPEATAQIVDELEKIKK